MSLLLDTQTHRKRLVVLGLDGLPLDIALQLGKTLPNIARIANEATTIQAEIPELSPVNWTSFFTGNGPEKHGVFGFSCINPRTYELSIVDSTCIHSSTIFDQLGKNNYTSRVINLPNTYPASPISGMLISGFVSHDLSRSAYPAFLASKLHEMHYILEADTNRGRQDLNYLLSQLHLTVKSRKNALDLLWPDLAWDLFVHVFTETDRLFHFFMDAVLDRTHSDHLPCMQFLAEWDNSIGNFLKRYDALPSPKRLIVLADHGFTQIKTEVCINTWLKQNGYLNMTHKPSNEWDATVISEDTTAFALDPGRIYIHTTDQFNRGTVSSDQYPVLLKEIKQKLLKLEFNGEQVLEQVHSRETLYPGANFPNTPDLICQPKPGFDLKAKFDRKAIFGLHGRHGTHTVDGAIFYDSQKATPSKMHEVGKIILDHFNI